MLATLAGSQGDEAVALWTISTMNTQRHTGGSAPTTINQVLLDTAARCRLGAVTTLAGWAATRAELVAPKEDLHQHPPIALGVVGVDSQVYCTIDDQDLEKLEILFAQGGPVCAVSVSGGVELQVVLRSPAARLVITIRDHLSERRGN